MDCRLEYSIFSDCTLENGVVIYKVENFDLSLSSYKEQIFGNWKINSIPPTGGDEDDPTLSAVGDKYEDDYRFVKFIISSTENVPYYQPIVTIEAPSKEQVSKKIGSVLNNIKINIPETNNIFPISSDNTSSPDLDLHAYTPDGKHVGKNYTSGKYEVQIPGANASGDLIGGEEWIFVPKGTEVRYYVDSHDVQKYLEDNPDINQADAKTEYSTQSVEYGENPQLNQLPDGNYTVIDRIVSEPKTDNIEPGITKEIIMGQPSITPTPTPTNTPIPTPTNATRGDTNRNGKLDTGDATLILRSIVGLSIPSQYQPILSVGDMNCNGRIDTGDAALVLRNVVGLPIPKCWSQ